MDYRKLIVQSWRYTQERKKMVFWFGFLPAILTTIMGVGYIGYQIYAFKLSYLFNEHDESAFSEIAVTIWNFLGDHTSLTGPFIIFLIVYALLYIFIPPISKASSIQVISRERHGQKCSLSKGASYGIFSFFKLFEYGLLIRTFTFFSVLFEMSFVVRNLGMDLFLLFLPIFIIYMILSVFLTLLFTFSEWFIVIDKLGVFKSMRASARLVVMHWKHTFLITILMILIGVRIIIQIFLVLLIPFFIILVSGYLASVVVPTTSILIAAIIGGILLLVASYLNGVVDIFSYSVWTFAFLDLTDEEELSAREGEKKVELSAREKSAEVADSSEDEVEES